MISQDLNRPLAARRDGAITTDEPGESVTAYGTEIGTEQSIGVVWSAD